MYNSGNPRLEFEMEGVHERRKGGGGRGGGGGTDRHAAVTNSFLSSRGTNNNPLTPKLKHV